MPIAGGLDIHRKQITFGYLDTVTGQVCRGQVSGHDRVLGEVLQTPVTQRHLPLRHGMAGLPRGF